MVRKTATCIAQKIPMWVACVAANRAYFVGTDFVPEMEVRCTCFGSAFGGWVKELGGAEDYLRHAQGKSDFLLCSKHLVLVDAAVLGLRATWSGIVDMAEQAEVFVSWVLVSPLRRPKRVFCVLLVFVPHTFVTFLVDIQVVECAVFSWAFLFLVEIELFLASNAVRAYAVVVFSTHQQIVLSHLFSFVRSFLANRNEVVLLECRAPVFAKRPCVDSELCCSRSCAKYAQKT